MLTDEQRKALEWAVSLMGDYQAKAPGRRCPDVAVIQGMLAASAAPAEGRQYAYPSIDDWLIDLSGERAIGHVISEMTHMEVARQAFEAARARSLHPAEGRKAVDERASAPITDAARDVLAERKRSVEKYGFTPEDDDKYDPGNLASAGLAYAMWAADYLNPYSLGDGDRDNEGEPPIPWPWSPTWWKPKTPRIALVKACNLILAEIERIDRAGAKGDKA